MALSKTPATQWDVDIVDTTSATFFGLSWSQHGPEFIPHQWMVSARIPSGNSSSEDPLNVILLALQSPRPSPGGAAGRKALDVTVTCLHRVFCQKLPVECKDEGIK